MLNAVEYIESIVSREHIRGVIFDLDGVIIKTNKSDMIKNMYNTIREYKYIEYNKLVELINEIEKRSSLQVQPSREYGIKINKALLKALGLNSIDNFNKLILELQNSKENALGSLNYGLVTLLDKLKESGVFIFLFSDRTSRVLNYVLREYGIDGVFSRVVSASDIDPRGKASPIAWFYLKSELCKFIKQRRMNFSTLLYIGDNYIVDTKGAFIMGIPTLIIKHYKK